VTDVLPVLFGLTGAIIAVSIVGGPSTRSPYIVLRQGLSQFEDLSRTGCVSKDGRFVAFVSREQLLSADSNRVQDVYVFDREHQTLTLETQAFDGSAANGSSGSPGLSADGHYLVFDSDATNLTTVSDDNMARDVFVRDRLTGTTRRISVSAAGREANATSANPTISSDGRVVAYASTASNLVARRDADVHTGIYIVRLNTGEVIRAPSSGWADAPSLSDDGRFVAFTSCTAFNPAARVGPETSACAVFVSDSSAGVTSCVSCGPAERALDPDLSGDGRLVVFTRLAGSDPVSRRTDVVLYDRSSSVATVVTRRANANSRRPKISADGQFIVFQSQASNLECHPCPPDIADKNLLSDIYLFDREAQTFRRISGPESWWVPSVSPWLDRHGRVIVFSSSQPLGPADPTTDFDLFIWSVDHIGPATRLPR
jgi:Tol biopolymer transport system component